MFAAASGDVASVEAIAKRKVDLNAREVVRGLTAAMFAAAANHAAVVTALGKAGADLCATSDPLDLKVVDRTKFKGVLFGNPEPPKEPGGEAGSVEGGGGRNGGNASGRNNSVYAAPAGPTRVPGVDRDFSGNELVNTHGGMTPLLFAARQGYIETATALLDAGVDVNQAKIGDDTTPLLLATINGHFDLAKAAAGPRRRPEPRGHQWHHAALRDHQHRVVAARRRRQAAGAQGPEAVVPRHDDGCCSTRARTRTRAWRRRCGTAATSPASTSRAPRRSGAPLTPATSSR